MNDFYTNLYDFVEDRYETELIYSWEYKNRQRLQASLMDEVLQTMGKEFYEKLGDSITDCGYFDSLSAFIRGLRFGLALFRI